MRPTACNFGLRVRLDRHLDDECVELELKLWYFVEVGRSEKSRDRGARLREWAFLEEAVEGGSAPRRSGKKRLR